MIDSNCELYNHKNGNCLKCSSGILKNGKCVVVNIVRDPNCNEYCPDDGACLKCSFGFYFGENGICTQISPSCKTWNS